jgi:hypothetical protein
MMQVNYTIPLFVVFFILAGALCKNVLVVAPGLGGHVRPNFDLVKKLSSRGHDVTLLTEALALRYINTSSVNLKSLILTDETPGALEREIKIDEKLNAEVAQTKNLMDGIIHFFSYRSSMEIAFYRKISELFQKQSYDLIVVDFSAFTVRPLIFPNNTPCVISWGTFIAPTDVPDVNVVALSNPLPARIFNTFFGRIHNFARSIAFTVRVAGYVLGLFSKIYNDETIPKEYREMATVNMFNAATDRCLSLVSTPRVLNAERYQNYQHRFLGTFMDLDEALKPQKIEGEIGKWINDHEKYNIAFGALGTTTYMSEERMTAFISGLDKFLSKATNNAAILLALSKTNYELFEKVAKGIANVKQLVDSEKLKVVSNFVPQRAILQHPSVKVFISHAGVGSVVESMLYGKPTLAMPYHFDHHYTATKVEELNAGLSLFNWQPTWADLIIDRDHVEYSFTDIDVAGKLEQLLRDPKYTAGAKALSREIIYGGGAERAAVEMEYLMDAGGLDNHRPLYMDYPLYRKYYLDYIGVAFLVGYISWKMIKVVLRVIGFSSAKKKQE